MFSGGTGRNEFLKPLRRRERRRRKWTFRRGSHQWHRSEEKPPPPPSPALPMARPGKGKRNAEDKAQEEKPRRTSANARTFRRSPWRACSLAQGQAQVCCILAIGREAPATARYAKSIEGDSRMPQDHTIPRGPFCVGRKGQEEKA